MRAISTRDAGLALISQIKRWMVAGAVMLTGAFSLLAAHAFRGHVRTSNAGGSPAAATQSQTQSQGQGTSDGGGLQQPASAPAPAASAPAPVVSGGS